MVNILLLLRYYLPLEKTWPFIYTDMTYNHTRFLCAKFGWKWSIGYRKVKLLNVVMYYYLPLETGRDPLYEQTSIPVTQGCFVPSLVIFAQWFWKRSPFGKGRRTSFEQTRIPLIKDALCQRLKLAQWFRRRRWKCEKFTERRTDGLISREFAKFSHLFVRVSRFCEGLA